MRPDIRWIVWAFFSIRDAISLYIIPPLGVKSAPNGGSFENFGENSQINYEEIRKSIIFAVENYA